MSDRDCDEVAVLILNVAGLLKGYGVGKADGIRMIVECLSDLWREATPLKIVYDPTHPAPSALQ